MKSFSTLSTPRERYERLPALSCGEEERSPAAEGVEKNGTSLLDISKKWKLSSRPHRASHFSGERFLQEAVLEVHP
jgi:hypothetical protein